MTGHQLKRQLFTPCRPRRRSHSGCRSRFCILRLILTALFLPLTGVSALDVELESSSTMDARVFISGGSSGSQDSQRLLLSQELGFGLWWSSFSIEVTPEIGFSYWSYAPSSPLHYLPVYAPEKEGQEGQRGLYFNWRVDEWSASWYPSGNFELSLGRLAHGPGAAQLLSPVNVFTRGSLEAILGLENPLSRGVLLQGSYYSPVGYFKASVEPFPPTIIDIPPGSPYFPANRFPEVVEDPQGGEDPPRYFLQDIRYVQPYAADFSQWNFLRDVSAALEWGSSFGPLDVNLLYYYGRPGDENYIPKLVFFNPGVDGSEYRIYLTHITKRNHSLGGAVKYSGSSLQIYSDVLFSFNKAYPSSREEDYIGADSLYFSPLSFQGVLGFNYRLFQPSVVFFSEYHPHWNSSPKPVMESMFSDLIISGISYISPDYQFQSTLGYAISVQDWSSVLVAGASYTLFERLKLKLNLPLFIGQDGELFGEFPKGLRIEASAEYRY